MLFGCYDDLLLLLIFFFRKNLKMGVAQNNIDMDKGTLEVAMGMLCIL